MRVFLQLTKNMKAKFANIELYFHNAEIECLKKLPPMKSLTCEGLVIITQSSAALFLLLGFVAPGCELCIHIFAPSDETLIDTAVFDLEVAQAAPVFESRIRAGVTDDQLSRLKARLIRVKTPFVSSKGINKIIRVCHFSLIWCAHKKCCIKLMHVLGNH
ncbi:unnamed protein product [Strongylus vulgaris]|uniref:Uncharacterized protein n=1 Tax=Strongylus vulgaris TaxID=40348 RepID=A0A3P7KUL9_STRVU|nr:unnamed protein product [Strongylus vulgaris]